jgi:hypothetical protein
MTTGAAMLMLTAFLASAVEAVEALTLVRLHRRRQLDDRCWRSDGAHRVGSVGAPRSERLVGAARG